MISELQLILDKYKTKNNKELSTIAMNLFNDFTAMKEAVLVLTSDMMDVEKTYNAVYQELQSRLKFENANPK